MCEAFLLPLCVAEWYQGEMGIASTLREVLVQVWGEVNHKDFGATHLGGKLSNLISLVPDFSNCKMNNT